MAARIATIGVYGFDADGFLATLRAARVGVLLDVRQRRGVRGSEYAWANSQRLQAALAAAGISYEHHKELAPTHAHLARVRTPLPGGGAGGGRPRADRGAGGRDAAGAALRRADAEACHRSLIAARLEREFGLAPLHLHP